jgi:raffinose/stachyose/melibiose transport system substrate-binding protein
MLDFKIMKINFRPLSSTIKNKITMFSTFSNKISLLPIILCLITLFTLSCGYPKSDPNTITVWHWMTDRHATFVSLAKQYEIETGIRVKIDLYAPSDAYSQKIIASAQSRHLPDIFGILDKKEIIGEFIKNGFVADLTKEFAAHDHAWEKSFFIKALDVNRFLPDNTYGVKPGIYGVPLDVTNIQMIFNRRLLNKSGIIQPPQNMMEFLEAARRLRRIGIPVFVSGWGEQWLIDCFTSNYAFNMMGESKVMDTFEGTIPYTDPDWIRVLQLFETFRDEGVFTEGIVTKSNKDAEQEFARERAAFTFNGSWAVNVYHDINPTLDYGVMVPPPANPQHPMIIWGGAGSSFMVNAASPKRDIAVDFLRWLSGSEAQRILMQETRNLPSNMMVLNDIPENLTPFSRMMEQTTHPKIWPLNEHPSVNEALLKGIQSIIIGDKTAKEVATAVQTIKQREIKRAAKRKSKR